MLNSLRKNPQAKFLFFLLSDILLIALSVAAAFLVRFEGTIPTRYYIPAIQLIVLAVVFAIPIFYFSKLYRFSWSYVSATELVNLFKATIVVFLSLSIVVYILKYFVSFMSFPRSVFLMTFIFIFIFCGGLRFAKRVYKAIFISQQFFKRKRTLVIGAGDAGEQIARSVRFSKSPYSLVGFVDDNPTKQGIIIHGVKVLGKIEEVPRIVCDHLIDGLIIAIPSANSSLIKRAIELGRNSGIKDIKILPIVSEIINGDVKLSYLKEVGVGDLLGRETIEIDTKEIANFIKNKAVLITGAAGSIGSELAKQVAKFEPSSLILLDQDETGVFNISEDIKKESSGLKLKSLVADITDKRKIRRIFSALKPSIVFHAAAYKHVPLMEEQPDEAVKNNIFGLRNVVESAVNNGVEKLIFISTDKAVNPTSVMGATKRVGEMICQAFNQKDVTKFVSVRFGNVLDSRGSVIPTFRDQIKRGGPVQVTHPDMKRYFMLNSEACLLVMQAGAMGNGGEVFVLDMGEPVKILDLALEMIKLSGLEVDKNIAITFSGVRPGEKLFEEMLTAEEGTIATRNQKIFIAKLSSVDQAELNKKLAEIEEILSNGQEEKMVGALKESFPFFKSNV